MKIFRLALLPALLLALLAAGCGGGGSDDVPADAVASVDGEPIKKQEFDQIVSQARKSYENQKREFPKAGTQEYQTLKNQVVQFLVQRRQYEQEAEDMGIEITDQQVEDRLAQIKKQYFGGDQKKYEAQLKEQGLSDRQVRNDIRAQLVSEKIFAEVTKDVKVTDEEVRAHYAKNKANYTQPASREVRHILVKSKAKADELHEQVTAQDGANFAALAKANSEDTGSKENGGKLTISKGQTVAPFDKVAFELDENEISDPVKTEFGYHIIQALTPVKKAQTTPLKDVQASIRQQLLQTKKNEAMTKWVDGLKKEYEDKVAYAVGFNPPAPPTTTNEQE
ncbi:MAG TPA: peptidylprolyl isomerase [Gaiellaceae bacterium]|nr:peptidylprolyl isomerase [Gaiellaceae bacterium]